MPKTAQFIEESKSLKAETGVEKKKHAIHPNSLANLKPYPKGTTGNPGGKNQYDVAREIAQAVFTENKEEIYKSMSGALLQGNAYVFKELADRAYNKVKETKEITHIHQDVPDADLSQRIAEIERDLGLARTIDEAGSIGISQARASETVGHKQD